MASNLSIIVIFIVYLAQEHTERENLCSLVTHPHCSVLCGFDIVTCGQEEVSIFDIDMVMERERALVT